MFLVNNLLVILMAQFHPPTHTLNPRTTGSRYLFPVSGPSTLFPENHSVRHGGADSLWQVEVLVWWSHRTTSSAQSTDAMLRPPKRLSINVTEQVTQGSAAGSNTRREQARQSPNQTLAAAVRRRQSEEQEQAWRHEQHGQSWNDLKTQAEVRLGQQRAVTKTTSV